MDPTRNKLHDKMILGDFGLNEHHILKLLFDCYCQNFHLCRHNGNPILGPNYFILQPRQSLLYFHSTYTEQVSAMLFPRRKGETTRNWATETRWCTVKGQSTQDIIPAAWYWKKVFCFNDIFTFSKSAWPLMAAKETWHAVRSSNSKCSFGTNVLVRLYGI